MCLKHVTFMKSIQIVLCKFPSYPIEMKTLKLFKHTTTAKINLIPLIDQKPI